MPPYEGTLSQKSFTRGEVAPAAWGNVTTETYGKGLRTARNVMVARQGGIKNRPGTQMVATTKIAGSAVRLVGFVFSNSLAFALEFGNEYIRVYQNGQQVQNGASPLEISTPYAAADLQYLQWKQVQNTLYLACAGNNGQNYPLAKLVCNGPGVWNYTVLTFKPATPMPGNGASAVFSDPAGYQPLFGSLPTSAGFQQFSGGPGGPIGGFWQNFPFGQLANNQVLAPGTDGFPTVASGQFVQAQYMVTAVDTKTGVESYPMPGTVSGWKGGGQGPLMGGYWNGGSFVEIYEALVSRFNSTNSVTFTGVSTAGNPLVVTNVSTTNFSQTGVPDYFQFSNTGTSLDGFVAQGTVSGNAVVFSSINPSLVPGLPATINGTLTCLTSSVLTTPVATSPAVAGVTQNENGNWPTPPVNGTSYVFQSSNGANVWEDSSLHTNAAAQINSLFVEASVSLEWTAASGSSTYVYNIYKKATNGLWGFMSTVSSETGGEWTYTDDGTDQPDTSKGPSDYTQIGAGIIGNPSVIGMFQQRLMLGNTPIMQDWCFGSNTGLFETFTTTEPTPVDSDTVQFELAGSSYNGVTAIVDNGFALIFTDTGEFSCYGSGSAFSPGPITPSAIGLVQQAFYGATQSMMPLSIGKNVLYVQSMQSKVRQLLYNYYINGYSGEDLTVTSAHLFDGFTVVDWCYQQEPDSQVWVVRSDGTLLCLTYLPELQLVAWTRCDTQGSFKTVCAIPEGNIHAVYAVVERFDGTQYVERFASRVIPKIPTQRYANAGLLYGKLIPGMELDMTQAVFMDCSSYFDGRWSNYQATFAGSTGYPTFTIGAGDYTKNGAGFTLQANPFGDNFPPTAAAGDAWILTDAADGKAYKCEILDASGAPGSYIVRPDVTLPADMPQGTVVSNWAWGIDAVSGLSYFPDGTEVSILADGAVVSSPAMNSPATVTGGTVTLDDWYAYIRVGLPYFSDARLLYIDSPNPQQTGLNKPQLIEKTFLLVNETRSLYAGARPPQDDTLDPLQGLTTCPARSTEDPGTPPHNKTGIMEIPIRGEWLYGGGLFIRNLDPLPMEICSVMPGGMFMQMGG